MGYASQYTGGDEDSRRAEADRLLQIIDASPVLHNCYKLSDKEREHVERMRGDVPVSGKQLLWLRDIKDKLL
jgi:hypothetical protein